MQGNKGFGRGTIKIKIKKARNRVVANLYAVLAALVVGLLYFYFSLPALNFQSRDFYFFAGLIVVVYIVALMLFSGGELVGDGKELLRFIKTKCLAGGIIILALLGVIVVGGIISAELFRAQEYRDLLSVETGDFAEDVDEISFDKIPMVDDQSAVQLGNRKLGELADMVSQFEVTETYTQINYQNRPVRVTYLAYGDFFKWLNNRSEGVPAYMFIDMTTQEVEVVRLSQLGSTGIKYSPSELFFRNISRYIRFRFPTYMFAGPNFEIDESGNPFWVCPRIVKRIGLFGGTDIGGAVLVNAVTGEATYYDISEVPTWVDRVFNASLIMEQYDYHGKYVNGFFNSIFGQKNVTVTTEGYNYIALNDDVYMYTGVTSVTGDQSNIGFILCNQRTKSTKFYSAAGATEVSAMSSAEGVVQHLNYQATFPLLLNIDGQPTYFMALKDNAQLVKMYALVNEQQYQIVATGSSVEACEQEYAKLMKQNGISSGSRPGAPEAETVSGVISEIRSAVIDGTTCYFLRLDDGDVYYVVTATAEGAGVLLNVGDSVTLEPDKVTNGVTEALELTIDKKMPAETLPEIPQTESEEQPAA